ncbi:MAG: multiheme c-type cytochrome [Pseudomonadota bacterium]
MTRLPLCFLVLPILLACTADDETGDLVLGAVSTPAFIGSESCADCHARQFRDWQGSHHQRAMQLATADTVLGDFDNASIDYFGRTSAMLRDAGAFVMRTENEHGKPERFIVSHTFGVYPLQQYLTEFADGRKQVLPFAWDTRPPGQGGQRWYHLYPDADIRHDDPLHWTGRLANWNYMCAECHSTNVTVGYDLDRDAFDTTFSEVSVGCEACHGPGAEHRRQAASGFDGSYGLQVDLDDRGVAAWVMDPQTGIARRSREARRQQQPESCGQCHSRRAPLAENYDYGKPLLDTHRVALLEDGLYHADGRIQDEVFVYGSFVQSKMYAAGVTCTDCHNAHSGELLTGPAPNDVCAQCHLPARFASKEHAAHNDCVSCHMQDEVYMGVDRRRDHSFRLPTTASDVNHYGAAVAYARSGGGAVAAHIDKAYSPIVRATLISLLRAPFDKDELVLLESATSDADPLVRLAALQAIHTAPPRERPMVGSDLLSDPVRAVRAQAALTFVSLRDRLPADAARVFPSAADDYRQSVLTAASQPESLAVLADFEFRAGDNASSLRYLELSIKRAPELAVARHAYGLALIRDKRYEAAIEQLELAHRLAPDNARFVYVYAVALNQLGRVEEVKSLIARARNAFPYDTDIQAFWRLLDR